MNNTSTDIYGIKIPNERQKEWYSRFGTVFFHFGINTFTNCEWGDGTASPSLFNPSCIDTDQWIRIIKEAGFDAAILTAKHHDGFCLWPTKLTEYSVKNSPYKNGNGDIVREFTDSCHKYGIKAGLYLSPWDRNCKLWGTAAYNEFYAEQLTELMTNYGNIYECWWDGAGSENADYDWESWAEIVRKNQPSCIILGSFGERVFSDIRWVGNEIGVASIPCWSTINISELKTSHSDFLNCGIKHGDTFCPAECDTSIRPGWFYHHSQDSLVKSPEALMRYYFTSYGRNCGMLLNIPPDKNGLIHENDVKSLRGFKNYMEESFSVNLADNADIFPLNKTNSTYFYSADSDELHSCITVSLPEKTTFNCLRISEAIEYGHRISSVIVYALSGDKWNKIFSRECIGNCAAEFFPSVTSEKLRIVVECDKAPAIIKEFGIFNINKKIFEPDSEIKSKRNILDNPGVVFENTGNELIVDMGGIFQFNTIYVASSGMKQYNIYVFDGKDYRWLQYGMPKSGKEVYKLSKTINYAYKFKIKVLEGKISEDTVVKAFYL